MEHLVQSVHEHCSYIVTEEEESGADLCDLFFVAWALWVVWPWCSGAVPKGAEGRTCEASSVVESKLVSDVCFDE